MEVKLSVQEEQALAQSRLLSELAQGQGYKEVLQPYLEDRICHSWLDPRKAKDEKEFLYQYAVAWGFAQAATEIKQFIEEAVNQVSYLEKKQKGEIVNKFAIGKR